MKITLFLGTAATLVLNTFVPANAVDRSRDLDVDAQPSSSLINILDIPVILPIVEEEQSIITRERLPLLLAGFPKRKPTRLSGVRLSVGGTWDTTEGVLRLNQGNFDTSDSSLAAAAYLRSSTTGPEVLGEYNKRGGGIRGQFINSTEVQGFWTQDYSDVKCNQEFYPSTFDYLWPRDKKSTLYWGTFRFSFNRDGSFTGVYGYCREEPQRSWSGRQSPQPN
jgi:hypothetical protein